MNHYGGKAGTPMKERAGIVDVLKGIGMLSVIIGHSVTVLPWSGLQLGRFVYLYQIMVFIFAAGFLADEKREPALFVGKRVYGLWKPFVLYNLGFVLLHNFFSSVSVIIAKPYTADRMLAQALKGIVFQTDESMLGAFWFLPFLLVTAVLLRVLFLGQEKVSRLWGGKAASVALAAVVLLASAAAGLWLHRSEESLRYHLKTVCLALPVMYLGWAVKKHEKALERWTGWPGVVLSAVLLGLLVHFTSFSMDLSHHEIENLWLFYPVTLTGMYFCLCLAKAVEKAGFLRRFFAFLGRYSLHFMALHFLAFKVLDKVVGAFRGDPAEVTVQYPCAYSLGLGYAAFAVLVISGGILLARKACRRGRPN